MIVVLSRTVLLVALAFGAMLGEAVLLARAQPAPPPAGGAPPSTGGAHEQHATPPGWKFTLPKGDPARGRELFLKLECHSCHEVKGGSFPAPREKGKIGPELSAMGPLHEAEYFAEAIINPGAVIERGKGYEARDGSSKMPSYNDAVTVQELVDLVAYLRGLRPPAGAPIGSGGSGGHPTH